ncbi:hypothetical protein, partial [Hufsiella arboris]
KRQSLIRKTLAAGTNQSKSKEIQQMKKIAFALIAIIGLGFTACKKDETATPSAKVKTTIADQKDTGSWD